ncbi:MAG: DUF2945 domain-containing protein [Bosea sp.]|uniref:DUF2945 domain-containing protein n=1 Tax=unclassified Bosea (in: a-proteobacteria) TaxID=2653178 RepID=UPI00095EB31F|nr:MULTISPECIES: DUF2945 domain-containing protein [unclassified Bosea (in: a-proteobacteria)]MBN9457932.1 DUF2945 domain-containing protein [Bosea sp. (in: a-proteobacteria)]OJV10464.1 MAG: DUF2945 domain-containing protein [Bosea sp. 67-29]
MSEPFEPGIEVTWRWGAHRAYGRVEQVFTRPVSRTIKGARVRRNASDENPAYLVTQPKGGYALKSHSELERRG